MDATKIFIIQTAFIGDALLTVPLLRRIRKLYPEAEITFLCRKGLAQVFTKLKLVNKTIEFDKQKTNEWDAIQDRVTKDSYDLIISPHQSFRSEMLVRKMAAKIKIGYKKWWNFFVFNKRVVRPMYFPEPLRLMALLEPIDPEMEKTLKELRKEKQFFNSKEQGTVNFTRDPEIPPILSAKLEKLNLVDEESAIDKLVKDFNLQTYRLILLAPGSVWNTKKWTANGFSELAKQLQQNGYQIALLGSESETEDCNAIAQQVPNVVNLAGKTSLLESLVLMNRSALLVSNDSGAAHLAALVGLKTISIFGPTVLDLGYRPWNNLCIVNQVPLKCRPCGKHGGDRCPIGTHECMKSVNPTNVLVNAEKLLNKL